MKNFIKEKCDAFLDKVLADGMSEKQRHDMQLAFFVGAKSLLILLHTITNENDEFAAAALMNTVDAEVVAYFQSIKTDLERSVAEGKNNGAG